MKQIIIKLVNGMVVVNHNTQDEGFNKLIEFIEKNKKGKLSTIVEIIPYDDNEGIGIPLFYNEDIFRLEGTKVNIKDLIKYLKSNNYIIEIK